MKNIRCLFAILLWGFALAVYAQQEHVVQRGEDFASIAKKYAITEQELMDANPASTTCYAGRKLIIPRHGVPVEKEEKPQQPLGVELKSSDREILTKSSTTTYQVGQALWRKGKYDEALTYLKEAVEGGEPRAYYPLGECYAQEDAPCHDKAKAVECFRKAAESVKDKYDESYWHSCGNLAKCYREGKGVEKSLEKAKKYIDEYQRYTDPDGREDASKEMRIILSEERALEEMALAEKKALLRQKEAERKARVLKQAETTQQKSGTTSSQKGEAKSSNKTTKASAQKDPFPEYTRVAGGLPNIEETKYWNRYGTFGYCSIRCYRDYNNGTVMYLVNPEPMDIQNSNTSYVYKGNRDGWMVLQRVRKDFSLQFTGPFGNPQDGIKWHVTEIPGEVLVSLDGNTVVCRDGGRYDTPVDKKTVDKLNEAYQDFVAQGVAAGIIKTDYEPSEVEKQLKADLEEMERKQEERQKRDRMIAEQRADLSRGHRRIQYKWTNTPSTHTTLCPVCNEFRQPHTHPVNDGRQ